jgi:hypothetical protein
LNAKLPVPELPREFRNSSAGAVDDLNGVLGGEDPALELLRLIDEVASCTKGNVGDFPVHSSGKVIGGRSATHLVIPAAGAGALEATLRAVAPPIEVNAVKVATKLGLLEGFKIVNEISEQFLGPLLFLRDGELSAP